MKKAFKLLSTVGMVASISAPLMVTNCSTNKIELDLSEVKTDQMFGCTTTYDIHPTHDISKIEFAYTEPKVIGASWEDNKLVITPKNTGHTTLTIVAYDNDGNRVIKNIDFDVDSKIHEFINERTFSLRFTFFNKEENEYHSTGGTVWLFARDTEKADNDYTYYLLTNNHVTSGFMQYLNDLADPDKGNYISVAYQDWDEAKGDTTIFNFYGNAVDDGSSSVYNTVCNNWSNSTNDKFCSLFTSYITSNYVDDVDRCYYRDMTFCKIDLSGYAETPLAKNRLDKLNEYANKHNNWLIEFDDYSDLNTENDVKSLCAGGYPAVFFDQTSGWIYPNHSIKFQSQIFEDTAPKIYDDLNEMLMDFYSYGFDEKSGKHFEQDLIYDATGEKHVDDWWCTKPEWISPKIVDKYKPYGPGSSGSLTVRASDLSDPDTYKATGIFWGVNFNDETDPFWWTNAHFTPFTFNYGKDSILPSDVDWNVISRFYNSDARKNWTQVNDCCYAFKQ